ncbi:MAG: ParB/RepB/Spo0J family partition protein [Chloroflexi bacterium]|nr:ParB/RepB/Spo0J family partition protein [Chloroflexota bacterium]MYF80288.1 ParB/RepB/Spo0J family partition protein [Chloroflexota bacterium]MYI03292.1 ParB/RepB/Spo0J family partition protein [Chloroflexota bacterium]
MSESETATEEPRTTTFGSRPPRPETEEDRRRRRLGRGLDSLIPSSPDESLSDGRLQASIGSITRNPSQPRREFDREALDELAASIREHGVLQPLLVRATGSGGYELIAGERRWRAASLAGLETVPVVVQEDSDDSEEAGLTLALVENLQRSDLNPIEMATAFEQLAASGWTQERIAGQIGRSRAAVANLLRLRKLPEAIQTMLAAGGLSEGHGRALLGAPEAEQLGLAQRAMEGGWTVRRLEDAVRALARPERTRERQVATAAMLGAVRRLESALGTKVEVRSAPGGRSGGGRLVIHWYDEEQLEAIATAMSGGVDSSDEDSDDFGI